MVALSGEKATDASWYLELFSFENLTRFFNSAVSAFTVLYIQI